MSESEETRGMCRALEALGAMTYPLVAGRYTPSGWPDRYLHHRRWHGFIEFKSPSREVEPLQRRMLRELNARCPGSAFVVRLPYTVEDASGKVLSTFDGTAAGLLATLEVLSTCMP